MTADSQSHFQPTPPLPKSGKTPMAATSKYNGPVNVQCIRPQDLAFRTHPTPAQAKATGHKATREDGHRKPSRAKPMGIYHRRTDVLLFWA